MAKVITVHHRIYNVGQFTFAGDLVQEYKFSFRKSNGKFHYQLLNPSREIKTLLSSKSIKEVTPVELDHKDLVHWMRDLQEAVAVEKEHMYESLVQQVKKFNKAQLVKMLEAINPSVYIEDYYSKKELLDAVLHNRGTWYKVRGIKGLDPRTLTYKLK